MGKIINLDERRMIAAGRRMNGVTQVVRLYDSEITNVGDAEPVCIETVRGLHAALKRVFVEPAARSTPNIVG